MVMQKSSGVGTRSKPAAKKTKSTRAARVTTPSSPYYLGVEGDRVFRLLNDGLQKTIRGKSVLFSTNSGPEAWGLYLASFNDPLERQHHNCHCCRRFIERYAGLVTISPSGNVTSALWNPEALDSSVPEPYRNMVRRMKMYVEGLTVTDQFLWSDLHFGTPQEGGFSHFWFPMPTANCNPTLTAGQDMAIRREDRKHLELAVASMPSASVRQAVHMLETGGLDRAETLLPMGTFLVNAQDATKNVGPDRRNRLLWYHVGQAARGWCTPRGSAFGALVEDIIVGKSAAEVTRAHNVRMDPLKYQRPQAAPKAGNIRQAEQVFEKLDLASALRRRPMRLDEAELLWRPMTPKPQQPRAGLFSHLDQLVPDVLPTTRLNSSPQIMTWAKFKRGILPSALKMRLKTPYQGNYCAFVTAVYPHAEPLLNWDRPEQRNPGSWYLYVDEDKGTGQRKGSYASRWGMTYNTWVEVTGISPMPCDWNGETRFQAQSGGRVLFILSGAADKDNGSLALFPETLRSELHSVRATIEAHSKSGKLDPEHRPRASGYLVGTGEQVLVEVTNHGGVATYLIDRVE